MAEAAVQRDFLNGRRKRDLAQRSIIEDLGLTHILSAGVNMQISTVVEIVSLDRTAQLQGGCDRVGRCVISANLPRRGRYTVNFYPDIPLRCAEPVRLDYDTVYCWRHRGVPRVLSLKTTSFSGNKSRFQT